MNIPREEIAKGYEPVTKLEFNIMANSQALAKMHFSESDIAKAANALRGCNKILKSANAISRNIQKMLQGKNAQPMFPESFTCDICSESIGIGIAKLTSLEQRSRIPSGWILVTLGKDRDYIVVPPGVVIDYSKGKVYVVCGTCQLVLVLKPTESGMLIHEMRNGHGFVDLDRIEKLIQEHRG